MFVLDTNVVAELRQATSGKAEAKITAWASGMAAGSLYVSVGTVLELDTGVLRRGTRPASSRLACRSSTLG